MQEKELISGLKQLKQIKPKKEWVVFSKAKIFEIEAKPAVLKPFLRDKISMVLDVFPRFSLAHGYRYAFASLVFMFMIGASVFIYAQSALPGDALFSLRKAGEKARTLVASEPATSKFLLQVTNDRLNDLAKIAGSSQSKNLAPAIKEFQASAKETALNIKNMKNVQGLNNNKDIVMQAKKIEDAKQKVEALGVVIGDTDLDNAMADIVQMQIKDLDGKILTDKQNEELTEAEKNYEDKDYNSALEKLIDLTQSQ